MVARVRSGLVNARKRQGHTLESLAHALSVEPSTVRRWERGTSDPMPLTWPRLAQELDITTDELVGFLAKPCCEKCGKVLAADNTENLCGTCRRDQHGQLDAPPHVGDEFFDTVGLNSPRLSCDLCKRVACAAAAFGISHQDAAFNKCGDVTCPVNTSGASHISFL